LLGAPIRGGTPPQRLTMGPVQKKQSTSGSVICGLVQLPASPQRHQFRDASATSQRPGRRDLSASCCRVRASTPAKPTPLVTIHTLLASARSGLDQSTNNRTWPQSSYVEGGCLNSSRSVIFPGSHRRQLNQLLYNHPLSLCLDQ